MQPLLNIAVRAARQRAAMKEHPGGNDCDHLPRQPQPGRNLATEQPRRSTRGGDRGGEIVVEGPPKEVAKSKRSYTGQVLKEAGL